MAITIETKTDHEISLDDYVSYIENEIDLCDRSSILESAQALANLANNKSLLTEQLLSIVKSQTPSSIPFNPYVENAFILWSGAKESFSVRANVWKTPTSRNNSTEYDDKVYSYRIAHDHNFDFLTTGYWGSGYSTKIYEYAESPSTLEAGEPVELHFLEDTKLPKGKTMFYRRSQDIHLQLPPDEMSISINLMINSSADLIRPQLSLDLERSKIIKPLPNHADSRVELIDLAVALCDENVVEPLETILNRTACSRTRAAARRALIALAPEYTERWLNAPSLASSSH